MRGRCIAGISEVVIVSARNSAGYSLSGYERGAGYLEAIIVQQHAPLVEAMPISDIYADGIGDIENLGDCFRTIYFTFSKPLDGGAIERVVVAKLVRPKKSILRPNGAVMEWLAREERMRAVDHSLS